MITAMNWNDFLQQYKLDDAAAEAGCALTALTSLGLIKVQGEDARNFLQGQLTNDINDITPAQARLGAWCNPKGRMLALMLVFQHGDDLYLQLPRERIEAVLKRLHMFVMRSRVTLEDVSEEQPIIALWGSGISGLVEQLPDTDFGTRQAGELAVIRFPGAQPRVQVIGEAAALTEYWKQAATSATLLNSRWWHLQNIQAGIPGIYDATAEAFIPQMVNLDLLQGISFSKGCYTGQEVVARMKYLGQLKRRMFLAHFSSEEPPKVGDSLFSPQSKSAQGAGRIVDAQPTPKGDWEALVVAEISAAESDDLHLGDAGGPKLDIQPPPYGLESPE